MSFEHPLLQEIQQGDFVDWVFPRLSYTHPQSEQSSEQSPTLDFVPSERQQQLLALLEQTPTLTAKTLAEQLGISPRAVEKQLNTLKQHHCIQRIGANKAGHWQVIKGQHPND